MANKEPALLPDGFELISFASADAYETALEHGAAQQTLFGNHSVADANQTPEGQFTVIVPHEDARALETIANLPVADVLEIERSKALQDIHAEHAETLRRLTGNATVEERDTWTRQQRWADVQLSGDGQYADLLAGLLTLPEREAAGDDAANIMAQKIKTKVDFTDLLISEAGGVKRAAEKAMEALETVQEIAAFRKSLAATKAQREADFMAKIQAMGT